MNSKGFCVFLSQQALQLLHSLPWSAAGHVLLLVDTVLVQGQDPEDGPSIMVPDTLIHKFLGIFSFSIFWTHGSRVGSQCLVSGVLAHTLKILCK